MDVMLTILDSEVKLLLECVAVASGYIRRPNPKALLANAEIRDKLLAAYHQASVKRCTVTTATSGNE